MLANVLMITLLACFGSIFEGKNLETECFDLDYQQYCSNIDQETSLETIIDDITLFENSYQFKPQGIAYNITIFHANDDENIISSIIMLGTVHSVTALELQWDVANWFIDLILNTSQFYPNKHVFFETHNNLQFGLDIIEYLFENNATQFRKYSNFIVENKESINELVDEFSNQMRGLKGKLALANAYMLLLTNSFDSDLQLSLLQNIDLFNYYKLKLCIYI